MSEMGEISTRSLASAVSHVDSQDPISAEMSITMEVEELTEKDISGVVEQIPISSSTPTSSSRLELRPIWPRFVSSSAPPWPFTGVVQLWADPSGTALDETNVTWWLQYWSEDLDPDAMPRVPLPGLDIDCLGQVGLVSHGESGIEVGGVLGVASGVFLVPWSGIAQRQQAPTDALLTEIEARPSNVTVESAGDVISLTSGEQRMSYVMREPAQDTGELWQAQARHDGDLLVFTVHPVRLECFTGVTWLVDSSSGEVVACGANTWATRFIAPEDSPLSELFLPAAADISSYVECGSRLEMRDVPIRVDR